MDAIALLKTDHKEVKALFDQVEGLGPTAHVSRGKLFKKIDAALTVHAEIEEKIFYPALRAKTKLNTEPSNEVFEAYEEHANVKSMLAKLEDLDPSDDTYNAKLQVLMELVRHHVKEEEGEMFKQARKLLEQNELKELGIELEAAKSRLQKR
jgi:hemerythrin superfamily protein